MSLWGALQDLLLPLIALMMLLLQLGDLVLLPYLGGQETLLVLPGLYVGDVLVLLLWLRGLLLCHICLWVLLILLFPLGGLLFLLSRKRLGDSRELLLPWGWLGVLLVHKGALLLLCRGSLAWVLLLPGSTLQVLLLLPGWFFLVLLLWTLLVLLLLPG